MVSTVAGGGGSTLSGYTDGMCSVARFFGLRGVSSLSTGDLVIGDSSNNRIRKISSIYIGTIVHHSYMHFNAN